MADERPPVGTIAWTDLTVEDADGVRGFYEKVVGWSSGGVDMGGYEDFNMVAPGTGDPVAGVCHARGSNADMPAAWMVYVIVADLDESMARCRELGGAIVVDAKDVGSMGRYCVIRDPAGAVMALFEAAS